MDFGLQGSLVKRLASIGALICLTALMLVFSLNTGKASLPRWAEWDDKALTQIPDELKDILDPSWLIQDVLCFDINGDGNADEILLVWKRGSYGSHRPTWVKRNDSGFSQHIFIYTRDGKRWKPIWMSSALHFKAASTEEGDEIPGTGRKSLIITEPSGETTKWGYLTWGLMRL